MRYSARMAMNCGPEYARQIPAHGFTILLAKAAGQREVLLNFGKHGFRAANVFSIAMAPSTEALADQAVP